MSFPNHRTHGIKGSDGNDYWSSYLEWMLEEDTKDWAYTFHKRFLQVLQHSKYPNISHWNLKSPAHNIWLEQIIRTYPDANLVVRALLLRSHLSSLHNFRTVYT
jgi:hypothetical protein